MATLTRSARIAGHGISASLPRRWEARLYLRPGASEPPTVRVPLGLAHPTGLGHPDASTNPVLHLANFALPPGRGDFGTGAVERMGPQHVFVSLFEYDPVEAHRPLFAALGMPRPRTHEFTPNALQRRLPGHVGCQRFFTAADRAFCLYAVLGSGTAACILVPELHDALGQVEIGPR